MARRTYSSYSEQRKENLKRAVTENRRKKKIRAVEYKGGRCRVCKYSRCMDALQFHHLDPSEKDFMLSRVGSWAWERIVRELDKCVLLCNRCHTEVHANVLDLRQYLTEDEIEKAVQAAEDRGPNILDFFHSEVAQLVDAVGC